jgi:hypothetical protein
MRKDLIITASRKMSKKILKKMPSLVLFFFGFREGGGASEKTVF